jgi:hypothetical protein
MWRDAIKGSRSTCYISFSLKADCYPEIFVVYDANQYGLGSFTLHDEPAVFLNLSAVFAEVQRAAEE